jgi:pilus assembly protein CpaE
MIHALSGEEGLAEKVRVVINRVGSDTVEEGISLKKAEEVIGKPIFWQIPNDTKTMIAARVAGAPLVKYGPKSKAQQAIAALASAVSGRPDRRSSVELKSSKGGWLFGRK